MARPKKNAPVDLSEPQELTAGLIERLSCRTDIKAQAFLRDSKAPGLRVRVTNTGAKSFVFEAKLSGKTIRKTIGSVAAWTIEDARNEANRLRVILDGGDDPRELDKEKKAATEAKVKAGKAAEKTVGEVWAKYLEARKPQWGELHYRDHVNLAHAGGEQRTRDKAKLTMAQPLAYFMPLRLVDVDADLVHEWAAREVKIRPSRARLAIRLLRAFLNWCAEEKEFKKLADTTATTSKKTREMAGRSKPKQMDYLQREQLPAWFANVRQIPNPVISAYLQCLLLTGARREELAELTWEQISFKWKHISMKDKVEDVRDVPLTPYVSELLDSLPRRLMRDPTTGKQVANPWVFSSTLSAEGRLKEPSIAHRQACTAANLSVSLHGLRRSFATLCEWMDIPGGISAQIQGHAPQGVREQNYIFRPIDLLRHHHERIEEWILEQAGIDFKAKGDTRTLRVRDARVVSWP